MANADDAARVEGAIADGTLLHPIDHTTPNIVDLAQAMAALAGAPNADTPSELAASLRDLIGEAEHYVFVLIDGLGMHMIDRLPSDSFLRSHVKTELRTVYPSSTAPALTSLATALWPSDHAIPGWWTYLPDAALTATILPYTERFSERPAQHFGAGSTYAFPQPSWMASIQRDAAIVQPRKIAGSVYSRYFGADRAQHGYDTLAQAAGLIAARIAAATGPTYTYWYISLVDTISHKRGPNSQQALSSALRVDQRIAEFAAATDGRARIVATADHGQIECGRANHITWARDTPLCRLLAIPPSAEPRAPAFHVVDGERDRFSGIFREQYGDRFALLTIDEADSLHLFGPAPVVSETRRRLGDFVGVALGGYALLYEPSPELAAIQGMHGGMTPAEMRIPLILA